MATQTSTLNGTKSIRTVSSIKEGWISKKGSKAFHSFRDRYMILWSNKRMEYYTDATLEKLKGTIDLKGLHRRFIQRSDKIAKTKNKNKNKKQTKQTMHGFKIITNKRIWYLCVKDANVRDQWIQTIRDVIDNTINTLQLQNTNIKTVKTFKTTNLLKSKINKIKLQNAAKWNQLMVSTYTVQPKQTNINDEIWSDRDEISNDIYSEDDAIHSDENYEIGENINNAENMDFNQMNEIQTDEKQNIVVQNKCNKIIINNDEEGSMEGSILGISLSTTPILHSPNSPKFTDFWDLESAQSNKYIELSDQVLNAIHCIKSASSAWISCFGAHIVDKGQCHTWKIKILARHKSHKSDKYDNVNPNETANVVIGICDADLVKVKHKHIKYGGFWAQPYFGYGYAGMSGNKLDANKKTQMYANKFKINDIITVSLNNNKLIFMCNNINNGIAFHVNNKRKYVLAVAFCNNKYDLQIYD